MTNKNQILTTSRSQAKRLKAQGAAKSFTNALMAHQRDASKTREDVTALANQMRAMRDRE